MHTEPIDVYSLSPDQIKSKLKQLFLHTANKGSRNNANFLTHYKLHKLLASSQELKNAVSPTQLDILIHKQTKGLSSISFDLFCNVLMGVAAFLYPDFHPTQALYEFFDSFVFPVIDSLGKEISCFETEGFAITEEGREAIFKTKGVIVELYKSLFPWECNSVEKYNILANRSKSTLFSFAQDCEIMPDLVSNTYLHAVWQELVELDFSYKLPIQDMGSAFTLTKFVVLLWRCAMPTLQMAAPHEKWQMLIERIEMSKRFGYLRSKSSNDMSQFTRPSTQVGIQPDILKRFYQRYCSASQRLKVEGMSIHTFVRMMRDVGVIQQQRRRSKNHLIQSEAELIFKSVSKTTVNFDDFVKVIQKVNDRLMGESLEIFIEKYFSEKDTDNEGYMRQQLDIIDSPELEDIMSVWYQTLVTYVREYHSNGEITVKDVIQFATDFEIFPGLVTKGKIVQFYSLLSDYTEYLGSGAKFFMDLIALCALETSVSDDLEERMKIVLEMIVDSQGPSKITLKTGWTRTSDLGKSDTLVHLKRSQNRPPATFDDILIR